MNNQPEALRLADELELRLARGVLTESKAADELRRLHAECAALKSGYDAARLEIESLRAAQPAPQQEPVAWYVTGCGRLLDEYDAEAEARRIGGTAKAMPLYTVPQPSPASQGDVLSQAARDVLAERQRQIRAEGWTQSHDDLEHEPGQLSSAAACYTLNASAWLKHPYASRADYANLSPINWSNWPWDEKWWKPKNERRDLVRAGALILAELERIDRADAARAAQEGK